MIGDRDAGGPPARHRALALVVDDNPRVRQTVSTLLAQLGLDAMTRDDAVDIVEVARRHVPAVIVLDLVLPLMDGAAAIVQLRQHPETRSIPIIVISGYAKEMKRVRDMGQLAPLVFLRKPFTLDDLRGAVMEARDLAPKNPS